MSLAFKLIAAKKTRAVQGGNYYYQRMLDHPLFGDSCLAYPNVLKDTDIIYNTAGGNLKEFIILKSANAPKEYRFFFETN